MNNFQLKLIAIITMAIDHIGLFFFPQLLVFRVIGRVAFPLFAWFIANGAHYTKNSKAYLSRLFIFAVFAQIPFLLLNKTVNTKFWELNVLFTLVLGLAAIIMVNKNPNKLLQIFSIGVCALAASLLQTDYGAAGVFSIVGFYLTYKNLKKTFLLQFAIAIIFYIIPALLQTTYISQIPIIYLIEPVGLISLLFIAQYNGKQGPKSKYLFYWFYPSHLLVLYVLKLLL